MRALTKYYFDYAATAPLDPRVLRAMSPFFSHSFGNPSSLYRLGREAKLAADQAHQIFIDTLGGSPTKFIFTSSATEANNLAILGAARSLRDLGNHVIVSAIEHKGILSVASALEAEGFQITQIGVDRDGIVDPQELSSALNDKTILVSITTADNETGTIQPLKNIADAIKKFRDTHQQSHPYLHTDATQAAAHLNLDIDHLPVDMLTLSAHKLGGPKGIGGLLVRGEIKLEPITYGGRQQNDLRPGTENISAIVGFARAFELATQERREEFQRIKKLRDYLERTILKNIPKVILNGHPIKRLPNFLNISILDIEGEAILLRLDDKKISVGTGSACNSQTLEPSHSIEALGLPHEYIHGSLRFTLGRYTTMSSVNYALKQLTIIVKDLRKMSPLNLKVVGTGKPTSVPQAFVREGVPHFVRRKKK
ncbi:MAG: cysteine desulfurase family protein [Patescibacteria group bacterium]|nr:cysteine desulfurase family protein [Patescibacteria group bacterium]